MFSNIIAKASETVLSASVLSRLRTGREWRQWVRSLTPLILDHQTHAAARKSVGDRPVLRTISKSRLSLRQTRCGPSARASCQTCNHDEHGLSDACCSGSAPDVGLTRIYMSIYLKANVRWTLDVARGYTNRLVKKLGLQLLSSNETGVSLQCTYRYKTLDLHATCHNWNEYGTDRGGTLEQHIQKERIGPCRDPFETFVIDYTGAVMPCCALRSDLPQGIKFAVGNLSEPGTTIFDIYAGQLSAWRRSLVTFGSKTSPCTTCTHRDIPEELTASIAARMEKHLQHIGRYQHFSSRNRKQPDGLVIG